jgi:periplasmic mercuric ion binding protein
MKTLKIASLLPLFITFAMVAVAQTKTETIPVSGNCGMCKTKIEKAAKSAGATTASWNKETKVITVKYNSTSTNAAKIQEGIAAVGYDTRDFKTTNEAYDKLPACCQYDRSAGTEKHEAMECCKDGKCSKPGHDGKDCCKKS